MENFTDYQLMAEFVRRTGLILVDAVPQYGLSKDAACVLPSEIHFSYGEGHNGATAIFTFDAAGTCIKHGVWGANAQFQPSPQ